MKNNIQTLIIIFLLVHFLILSFIGILNYKVDPYRVFKYQSLTLSSRLADQPFIKIKLSKNKKFDKVIVGGSSVRDILLAKYDPSVADLSFDSAGISDVELILKFYMDLHPETKTVFFPIDTMYLDHFGHGYDIPKSKSLSLVELYRLFLSKITLKHSLQKITNNELEDIVVQEKVPKSKFNEIKNTKETLLQIIKFLKEKNIEVICFVPPNHYLAQIYTLDKHGIAEVQDLKKQIVNEGNTIIDFSINDINSVSIRGGEFQKYFKDGIHIKPTYAEYIYRVLLNKKDKNTQLYTVLTKKNIDTELKKQQEELNKYRKNIDNELEAYL